MNEFLTIHRTYLPQFDAVVGDKVIVVGNPLNLRVEEQFGVGVRENLEVTRHPDGLRPIIHLRYKICE